MAQFGQDQLGHAQLDRAGRARQRNDDFALGHACGGAGQHGGRADVFITQHAKHLAKTGNLLFQQALNRLKRGIARRNAGPAVGQDHVHLGPGQQRLDRRRNLVRLIFQNLVGDHRLLVLGQQGFDALTALVGGFVAGIAEGDDRAADRTVGLVFMFVNRHSSILLVRRLESDPKSGPIL